MRSARIKLDRAAYYHVTSRVLERRHIFDPAVSAKFVELMRRVEAFSGVQVVTHCVMSNHIHLLLRVPDRREVSDADLLARVALVSSAAMHRSLQEKWKRLQEQGSASALDELRQGILRRMFDLSFFMKTLKQLFSEWFNRREKRRGPVWEGRFKSSLIENKPGYLATAAAYIDNNPVRAGLVRDAKDHRGSGYAAALAGDAAALAGLATLTEGFGVTGPAHAVLRRYRLLLFGHGPRTKDKAGYSPGEIQEVFARNGGLHPWELARHRLRWLSDGAVIGSKAFVQELRTQFRDRLGLKRATGAYPAGGPPGLCSLRSLRTT